MRERTAHTHNLLTPTTPDEGRFGIRQTLPENDPLIPILGADWELKRWFSTETERDQALAEMRRRHEYSRIGDRPTLVYEKITRE